MTSTVLTDAQIEALRIDFQRQANDAYGFKRSRRGGYVNPAVARDWKWFLAGAAAQGTQHD
jgi:hypothetical protein